MATKTEQLPQEVVEKLKKYQLDSADLINELGQIEVRFLELKKYKKSIEETFINLKSELDKNLAELEQKYPNGEINLNDGTVSFEEKN